MRKKLIAIFLALTVAISLTSMPAMALTDNEKNDIKTIVSKLVKDYAASVNRSGADDDAFWEFFNHGFYGNGKSLTLTEKDAVTASLFNSCLMQEALIEGISNAIVASQQLGLDVMFLHGGPNWHNFNDSYSYMGYVGEKQDPSAYIGPITSIKDRYSAGHYTGPQNANDDVLHLLVGGLEGGFVLRKIEAKEHTIVYHVELKLSDHFDFKGTDYDYAKDKGYNTTTDNNLVKLGLLLNLMGLKDFYWEFNKTLQVEVPNSCDHSNYNSYHWTYDAETVTMTSHTDGFTPNIPVKRDNTNDDGTYQYFELTAPVMLNHDRPWVMEYTLKGGLAIQLFPTPYYYGVLPLLVHNGRTGTFMVTYEFYYPEGIVIKPSTSYSNTKHYAGAEMLDRFDYSYNHSYFCRLENKINEDSSNMVYLTIYNETLDTAVFGPVPMNTSWILPHNEKQKILQPSPTDMLNGMDFVFNYAGHRGSAAPSYDYDLKIWENGKNAMADQGYYIAPTCTQQGGIRHLCTDCGYSYLTEIEPALGHNYGEYAFDNNATCTADGTQTRKCTLCDAPETVTAPNTAMGHDYKTAVTVPTCTADGFTAYTCAACGDQYVDDRKNALGHTYQKTVTESTCTEQGFTTYRCTVCGDEYVDDYTDVAEHTVVIDPAVKSTCSEKGKTEGSHCGVCGVILKKQALISLSDSHHMEESIIKMPTYDEPGQVAYICQDCGKTDYIDIPPMNKPTPMNPFADVMETDWFYEPVLWAVSEGVTGGKTETSFAPNEGCTRAQVVTFLWAANGKPEPKSMDNPFHDVSDNAWYLKPVLWAVEQGITGGVAEGKFGPDETCTRAQIATFLYAGAGKPEVKGNSTFKDVANSDWFAKPVIWAAEHEVTGGIGDGKFGPNNTCTRAQVVTFLYKVYG